MNSFANEIAVPILATTKNSRFLLIIKEYKLILFHFLYLLFSLNIFNELSFELLFCFKRIAKIRTFFFPPNFFEEIFTFF